MAESKAYSAVSMTFWIYVTSVFVVGLGDLLLLGYNACPLNKWLVNRQWNYFSHFMITVGQLWTSVPAFPVV